MAIKLERFAFHFVDKANGIVQYSPHEEKLAAIHPTIIDFFEELTHKLWDAEDSGNTVSGHFSTGVNPSSAAPFIHGILANETTLLQNSTNLAKLLFQVSPGNASPGVLAVLTFVETITKRRHVAIYKIRCEDTRIIRILSGGNLPELSVEEVQNILLKELQKGALVPHPDRQAYDLKLTDLQSTLEPSKYFGTNFLGCISKKADEHQIKKLVPELLNYGSENHIAIDTERIPAVLEALGRQTGSVTLPVIEEVIEEEKLYDAGYSRQTFSDFAERSPNLQQFDVDAQKLAKKKNGDPRKLTYLINAPDLDGIVISGPPEAMRRIRTTQGDTVIIHIEALEANLEIKYE